ncbi:membrane protein insertase YidC [bacterium]|jgi:YidC/Oxa1 family membrane protein insertase|nr:membrane protein insertase YidC [bacterium]MBT5015175.1 membrane protein insertase YidC [bacterium]
MRFKDLFFPLALALLVTAGIQFFWGAKVEEKAQTARLHEIAHQVDPDLVALNAPDYEVNLSDTKSQDFSVVSTTVDTDYGSFVFSTEGAAIEKIDFTRKDQKKTQVFETFEARGQEDRLFLLAFNDVTPYYYHLDEHKELEDRIILSYTAPFTGGTVTKEYTVFRAINKIDLKVSMDIAKPLEKDDRIRTRLIFQSPRVQALKDDTVRVFFEESGSMKTYTNVKEITNKLLTGPISLLGMDDRYFVYSLVQDSGNFFQRAYFRAVSDQSLRAYLQSKWITSSDSWTTSFYVGPKQISAFSLVDSRLDDILDYGWLSPLSKLLLKLLGWLFDYVKNFGWAIILLTILLKLLLLPFTWRAEQKMKGAASQKDELNRKLAYLKERYKDDPEKLAQERTEAMRKHGMPGLGSCLPMLLQFPIFIALNRVLTNSISLYMAPFLWIPNLAAKDPYYILPILVVIAIILHTPSTSKDPKQGLMPYAMALFFGAITMQLSAGLVLFILTSTVTGVVQAFVAKLFKKA